MNSQFYGYWKSIDHNIMSENIETIMMMVNNKLKAENEPFCTLPNNIHLENFLHLSFGNKMISSYVTDVSNNISTVPLNKYLAIIDKYYDIDVTIEYQDLIFIAILRLIEIKLKKLAKYI